MWQDVDPDVDLFASGIVSELDETASEWGTGHPLSLDGPCAIQIQSAVEIRSNK